MIFTVLTSVLLTIWILLCILVYVYYYLVEVYLDTASCDHSPSSAHTNLKLLIEKILRETVRLPHFRKVVNTTGESSENERTYEELLATAILNKIISKHENELPSSSEASTAGGNLNKEFFFGDGTWETKWKHTEEETTSVSSIDEYLQSDSSLGSTKFVDRVSLTIQQRIEEVPREQDETDNDFQYFHSKNSSHFDNENNWYLQKRPFPGTNSPIPVPMLVPNPVTAAKVLIGDREVDDTSDLSDASSDSDLATETRNLTINSTVIIDEKPFNRSSNSYFSDEETSFDSGVRDDRDDFSDREKFFHPGHKSENNIYDENVENVSLISSHSNMEKDSEYLEKYASLPKTIFKSSSPAFNSLPSSTHRHENPQYEVVDYDYHEERKIIDPLEDEATIFEGSYSRKEKEKWKHPVNMPHNPYSEENIRRRIRDQIYGRDYYTKLASAPSGKAKSDEVSLSKHIDQLEARYMYSSLPRSLYTPRNSTKNFVKNPLLNFPENRTS